MPYSVRVSPTRIYQGTTQFHFTINFKTWTCSCELWMPNQWTQYCQLLISKRTLAGKISMPKQWARSCKPLMSKRTLACKLSMPNQTNQTAIDVNRKLACKLSMPNQWARSSTHLFKTRDDYSLAVIKAESLYQLTIFGGFYVTI